MSLSTNTTGNILVDLEPVFTTEAKLLGRPAHKLQVDSDRPTLTFRSEAEFIIGQRIHLSIKMRDPDLEISFDSYVTGLHEDGDQKLIAVYPSGLNPELLAMVLNSAPLYETRAA